MSAPPQPAQRLGSRPSTSTTAGGTSGGGEIKHTVSADSKGLALGNYDGIITVSAADAPNSPQFVPVSLRVGTAPPPSTENRISISCRPSSAGTGTNVAITISIKGNLQEIYSFGLELTFDSGLFDYQSTGGGNLTGGWSVAGGESGGVVTVGGYAGGGGAIPAGSSGSIAVVKLKVKGAGYSNGHHSQITIGSYSDDISGMQPQPATTTFTFQQ